MNGAARVRARVGDRLRAGFRVVVVRRAEVVIARDELTRLGGAHLVRVRVRVRVCVGVRVRTRVTLTLTLTSLTLTLTLPSLGVRPSSPRARCTWRNRTRPSPARYHEPTASGADTYLRGAEPACARVCWRRLRGGAMRTGTLASLEGHDAAQRDGTAVHVCAEAGGRKAERGSGQEEEGHGGARVRVASRRLRRSEKFDKKCLHLVLVARTLLFIVPWKNLAQTVTAGASPLSDERGVPVSAPCVCFAGARCSAAHACSCSCRPLRVAKK